MKFQRTSAKKLFGSRRTDFVCTYINYVSLVIVTIINHHQNGIIKKILNNE